MSTFPTRELFLKARPVGIPQDSDIGFRETTTPEPAEGQLVTRNLYLSLSIPPFAITKAGKIKFHEQIIDGLENTPAAFRMLFDGSNTGKLIVKISA